ncbi:MAG: RNA methyltransferase substrate-binding domain-containing protein, partial [Nitrolancea sp.]
MDDELTPELITSKNNARIKNIRKLRSRQERDRTDTLLVDGIRQVSEAIQSGAEIEELLVAPDLLRSRFALDLVAVEQERGTATRHLAPDVFQSISERDHPQGLAAVVRQRWTTLDAIQVNPSNLWVALESVADPGNLGTILRTSDAVGAAGVILLGQST